MANAPKQHSTIIPDVGKQTKKRLAELSDGPLAEEAPFLSGLL